MSIKEFLVGKDGKFDRNDLAFWIGFGFLILFCATEIYRKWEFGEDISWAAWVAISGLIGGLEYFKQLSKKHEQTQLHQPWDNLDP